MRFGLFIGRHQFVAGRDNAHVGLRKNFQARAADRGQEPDFRKAQPDAGAQQQASGGRFASALIDELPQRSVGPIRDEIAVAFHMLHHDDRVGARGDRRAGHDLDRFPGLNAAAEALARSHFPGHSHAARHVGRADRETVAGAAVQRGVIAIGVNVLSQNAAIGGFQIDSQARRFPDFRAQLPDHSVAGVAER